MIINRKMDRAILRKVIVEKDRLVEFYYLNKKKGYRFSLSKVLDTGIYDENLNKLADFSGGSGSYSNLIFKCSKCGKIYSNFGSLRKYHFKNGKCKTLLNQEKKRK